MRPQVKIDQGEQDLFRSRLDQIIHLGHPLVKLGRLIDGSRLEQWCGEYYSDWGRPGIRIRLILGLHLLKYIYGLSDEDVCMRWEENPYFQYFCGEIFFHHRFPMECSSMSHFRHRIPPEILEKVLQESLGVAYAAGALALKDLRKVVINTTVQEKAIAHPTDHGFLLKAVTKLGQSARQVGIKIRQSYHRVVKAASLKVGRYLHARQMKRARRQLKFMRIRLGRLIRDVERKSQALQKRVSHSLKQTLSKAKHIYQQKRGDPGYLYAWPTVSARGKPEKRMNLDAKSLSPRNSTPLGDGILSFRRKRFMQTLMMVIR